jgi:hypothetical protein
MAPSERHSDGWEYGTKWFMLLCILVIHGTYSLQKQDGPAPHMYLNRRASRFLSFPSTSFEAGGGPTSVKLAECPVGLFIFFFPLRRPIFPNLVILTVNPLQSSNIPRSALADDSANQK